MIEGLVSTIIPVYNRPTQLQEAVQCVLSQTHDAIEVIIVDDGSTDPSMAGSLENCRLRGQGKVQIFHQQNHGPGAARQHGLKHAKGEFVQFLDSDDLLYPHKFELQINALRLQPDAGVAYGKTVNSGAVGGKGEPWKKTGEEMHYLFPTLLCGRIWDTSTPFYRAALVREVGGWSNLINEEDWEFDCRIAAKGTQLAWIDEWVSEQRDVATNRASANGSSDPHKLRDRAKARHLILESAMRAGISHDAPEFQSFISYSFLVARQCAAAGLNKEARDLVQRLNKLAPRKLMSLFLISGKLIGYQHAARIAQSAHQILRRDIRCEAS